MFVRGLESKVKRAVAYSSTAGATPVGAGSVVDVLEWHYPIAHMMSSGV